MLWVVLATVTSALPVGKVASTYDEAACTEAEKAQARDDDSDVNCSEPPPPVPAVLDCNDARVSLWLGDMIGSCDMPKSQIPGTLPVVRAANSEQRLCRDGHCGLDAVPIRPAARSLEELTPILAASGTPLIFDSSTSVDLHIMLRASQRDGWRLERPPRAS